MYTVQQAAEIQSGIKIITAKYIEDKTERYFDILQGVDSDNMNPAKKQAESFK